MNQIRWGLIFIIFFNIEVGCFRPADCCYICLMCKPVAQAVKCCADKWSIFSAKKTSNVILTISTSIMVIFLNTVNCFIEKLWYLFCQMAMLISRLYYYLVHFIAFLDTLRNISRMNFVKQPINRTSSCRILWGFPQRSYFVLQESPGRPLSDSCSRNPHWRQCKPIATLNARGLSVNKRH